ncbi:EGF-like domain-containing protein [Balamuthia mandrillaris]
MHKLSAFLLVILLSATLVFGGGHHDDDDDHHGACTDDSWRECIGNRYCRCYSNSGENSVERRLVDVYNQELVVARNYDLVYDFFREDAITEVPLAGIYINDREKNYNYFLLGDPDIADLYEVRVMTTNEVVMEQRYVATDPSRPWKKEKHTVVVHYCDQTLYSIQLAQEFTSGYIQYFYFDELHQLYFIRLFQDTLQMWNNLPADVDKNITRVCDRIQHFCTGPNQVYDDRQHCEDFMSSIPLVSDIGLIGSGNTVACRAFHTYLANTQPDVHCKHVSPFNINPLDTPCAAP